MNIAKYKKKGYNTVVTFKKSMKVEIYFKSCATNGTNAK